MPGVKMCPVCRGSKQKCTPAERTWISDGHQDKCDRCTLFKHNCGPHEYPPVRSRASKTSDGTESQIAGSSSQPPPLPQRLEAQNDTQELKQEVRRRLRGLDMQLEATRKLQLALDYLVQDGRQAEPIYTDLLSSRNANVRLLAVTQAQAEAMADRLTSCGEIEAAEAAYERILNGYRASQKSDIKAWHETKSLLRKFADILSKAGEPHRAENLIWEALELRESPPRALPSDLELLKSLAMSLAKTSIDVSRSIHSVLDGAVPDHFSTPFPPLQCMMQSSFAATVSGSPFQKGEVSQTNMALDEPIVGGITTVMNLLRALPEEALEARDVYGRSPFYMASSLGMEGLGRGILLRLAEVSGCRNDHQLNNRDSIGQTVLGASIIGGCSMQYLRFLIESGAQVDPDPLTAMPYTPLQAAVLSGSSDIVGLLLGYGAEIDRVFRGNDTPLTLAWRDQHADIIQQLSDAATAHSSPNFDLG